LQFLPNGLKGVAFAALAAAIVSSLASMLNSTSTIFTMDIYKPYFDPKASDKRTVNVGRLSAATALIIACLIAPFLSGLDQAFQYIQEYTGMVSPGILAVFILGLFWKKATNKAAIWGALMSIPVALFFKIGPKGWLEGTAVEGIFPNLPFLDQMGLTFLISLLFIVVLSYKQNKGADDAKGIEISRETFKTGKTFNILSYAIIIILVALYALFW